MSFNRWNPTTKLFFITPLAEHYKDIELPNENIKAATFYKRLELVELQEKKEREAEQVKKEEEAAFSTFRENQPTDDSEDEVTGLTQELTPPSVSGDVRLVVPGQTPHWLVVTRISVKCNE